MKKGKNINLLIIFIFILIFLSIGFISALSCEVITRSNCQTAPWDNIIMGVSNSTNAHGEFPDAGTYSYVLCCDFGDGDISCSTENHSIYKDIIPQNKIIGLSDITNAHAEIISEETYTTNVCYKGIECVSTSECDEIYLISILSLSNSTNAHIGGYTEYSDIKICCRSAGIPGQFCILTNAFWSKDGIIPINPENKEVMEGTQIKLVVKGKYCDKASISFEVREKEPTGSNPVTTNLSNVIFNEDIAIGTWTTEWIDDGLFEGEPEYYFVARLIVNPTETITSNLPRLTVTKYPPKFCADINLCSNYPTQEPCDSDFCEVAENNAPSWVDCSDSSIQCSCSWDTETGCESVVASEEGTCGNGVIDAGEQCDGDEWGPITNCNDFDDLDEGEQLFCDDNCIINTFLCTGGVPGDFCTDNEVINIGEQCDGNTWGPITNCSDFDDFTEGDLSCINCTFDTSLCTGGDGWDITLPTGTCKYQTLETEDNCSDDGFLTYSWTAIWEDGEGEKPEWCKGGSDKTLCPAQIQLPFFGVYGIIITLVLIALIYIFLIRKKKLRKRGSKKKK